MCNYYGDPVLSNLTIIVVFKSISIWGADSISLVNLIVRIIFSKQILVSNPRVGIQSKEE